MENLFESHVWSNTYDYTRVPLRESGIESVITVVTRLPGRAVDRVTSWLMPWTRDRRALDLVLLKTHRVEELKYFKSVEIQSTLVAVVCKFREGMSAYVSISSLDHESNDVRRQ
ncbi:hypothetical protein TNCV_3873721 [Trichonephila clavipes]|nr:hypothetical protein TNCV_3873721 [Trichonephila clavipes]